MKESARDMDGFLASIERRAFRMARIATSGNEDALDIVQDSMLSFVKKYSTRPETEWKPIFFKILQNRIRDWYRKEYMRRRWFAWLPAAKSDKDKDCANPIDCFPDRGNNPAETAAEGQSMAALDAALRELPLRQQQVFLLRAWEGLSVEETARAMKCSAGSVKTHYSRAVHSLRKKLEGFRP
jgi:RNA polymerase sigma-70 factor (ECF subfamily)